MERREPGLVVPIPTLPFWRTLNNEPSFPTNRVLVAIREPTVEVPDMRELPCTDNNEAGVEVPNPNLLAVLSQMRLESPPKVELELN